uniref:family 78 glycoside hydrolase catalytic domain n=1 Tax=Paenibacillus psychroresistens TaxID=1778678 RepID=UPI001D043C36|nr:family 78 glycoside hydrolase catalytic domain [Paenibacillus psychroresistens]
MILQQNIGDLWDSGKVESDETLHVEYTGVPLSSGEACYWKVYSWVAAAGESEEACESRELAEFSIGLLHEEDWKASWITAAEFISDTPAHIGYMSLETKDPLEQKWVQIDLGHSQELDGIRLYTAVGKRGNRPYGGEASPTDGFPVRFIVEVSDNEEMYASQRVVDCSTEDVLPEPIIQMNFNQVSGRYVRFTGLKQLGSEFMGESVCLKFAEIELLNKDLNIAVGCRVTALDSYENTQEGFSAAYLTDGKTAYDAGSRRKLRSAPLMQKEIACSKPVSRAMVYATALGNYELYINGERVGDHCLAPGLTQYEKRVAVQAYNVTALLNQGDNAIGAILADGWYRSRYRLDGFDQFKDFAEGSFGDAIPRLLVQIEIEYSDGSAEIVGTDESWTYSMEGPYRKTSMYDGILYDSRLEPAGWSKQGFNDSSKWSQVSVSDVPWPLIKSPQTVQPVRRIREYPFISEKEISPGAYLYDFGQSVGGVCRVTLQGAAGQKVKLRHIPVLNEDGSIYTDTLWGAYDNGDIYILNGQGPQTFEAAFTFHGFRYVELTGLVSLDNLLDITAVMIADDYPEASSLKTSDERLNKLWSNALLTYQACMKSVVVDVCDRDERWPWMGDCFTTHSQSLPYMLDIAAHFTRRCRDLQDDQTEGGYFSATAPRMNLITGAACYSDAAITTAWSSYMNYGDIRLLQELYPSLLTYYRMLQDKYESGAEPFVEGWTDHLASNMTIKPGAMSWKEKGPAKIGKAHYEMLSFLQVSKLMRNMAEVLADLATCASIDGFAKKLRQEFVRTLLESDEKIDGAQTLYGLLLGYGIVQPEEKSAVLDRLLVAIEQYNGFMTTGTPSTNLLLNALSDNGHHELAYGLVMRPEYPSFGSMIDQGATVIWERLDSHVPGLGFNPSGMNGLIHVGFASVAEWIFGNYAGIRPHESLPSYKQVVIQPCIDSPIDHVQASYRSVRGPITTEWSKDGDGFVLKVEIPANMAATVIIPKFKSGLITESGALAAESKGVTFVSAREGASEYLIESGAYFFHSQ